MWATASRLTPPCPAGCSLPASRLCQEAGKVHVQQSGTKVSGGADSTVDRRCTLKSTCPLAPLLTGGELQGRGATRSAPGLGAHQCHQLACGRRRQVQLLPITGSAITPSPSPTTTPPPTSMCPPLACSSATEGLGACYLIFIGQAPACTRDKVAVDGYGYILQARTMSEGLLVQAFKSLFPRTVHNCSAFIR